MIQNFLIEFCFFHFFGLHFILSFIQTYNIFMNILFLFFINLIHHFFHHLLGLQFFTNNKIMNFFNLFNFCIYSDLFHFFIILFLVNQILPFQIFLKFQTNCIVVKFTSFFPSYHVTIEN